MREERGKKVEKKAAGKEEKGWKEKKKDEDQ